MITPENEAAFDNEDQKSQQDIQSDGIEVAPQSEEDRNAADIDKLNQAERASEASFTLDVDRGIAPEQD